MVMEILWDVVVCRFLNGLRVFENGVLGGRSGLMGKGVTEGWGEFNNQELCKILG
jgi:hypothetical protein